MYAVKTAPRNVDTALFYQTTWLVEETVEYKELTITSRAKIIAPEGKFVTMTVNGIGRDMKPGTYYGKVVLTVADVYHMAPHGLMRLNQISRDFHTAVCIEDGAVSPEKGVPEIVEFKKGGELTDRHLTGAYIQTTEPNFNGVVVSGDSEFEVADCRFAFEGDGDNDFLGTGVAVQVIDNGKLTIRDSQFTMNGITRCAIQAGGDSQLHVIGCDIINLSREDYWPGSFSWQVCFCGTNRLVQLADNARVTYENCRLFTNGWGITSVDGTDEYFTLTIKNCDMQLFGPRAHGYGAFCIGEGEVTYDNARVDVNGYPLMLMGMEGHGKANILNGSRLTGRRFGVFVCSDDNSVLNIADSTLETGKSSLCVKGSSTIINIRNTKLLPENGVALQLMDTDESGMNIAEFFVPVGVEDVYQEGRDLFTVSPTEDVTLNLADMAVQGDFLNSTSEIRAYRNSIVGGMGEFHDTEVGLMPGRPAPAEGEELPAPRHGGDDLRGAKNLGLNLTNARVEGVISSACQKYRDGLTHITEASRLEISNVTQWAAPTVNNGVVVTLDAASSWKVTGTSYITGLDIAQGAVVEAARMTVDGVETPIVPGSYRGKIVLE